MRYRSSSRAPIQIFAVLTLLLSTSTIVNPVNSSLQRESVVSNHGTILVVRAPAQESFTERIFFEYGGETGDLQPPWDQVRIHPSGVGSVSIQSSVVRSGSKAVKFTLNPSQSDGITNPRAELFELSIHNLDLQEFYVSYWLYLDTSYSQTTWDMGLDQHYEHTDGNWYDLRKAIIKWRTSTSNYQLHVEEISDSGSSTWTCTGTAIPKGQWIHLQRYYKVHTSLGQDVIWQDNTVVWNKTNVNTAQTRTAGVIADRISAVEVKAYTDNAETGTIIKYVDDFVVASEKVPEDYSSLEVIAN